jgi:uncharacterized FlgJ-related protein
MKYTFIPKYSQWNVERAVEEKNEHLEDGKKKRRKIFFNYMLEKIKNVNSK